MSEPIQRIAFIGFGEVGGIFGKDLAASGRDVVVYDPGFADPAHREQMARKAADAKVRSAPDLASVVREAQLIVCAATASSALAIAREAAALLRRGQVYVDLNSVSPDTKKSIAEQIDSQEGDFVEAAVMAAVKPTRLRTPILLGGARAPEVSEQLRAAGMETSVASEKIGVASAIKMCRSIVMKGLAALAIESLFAARHYGAEDAVLASFDSTYPSMGWKANLPDSLVMRSVEHSRRRAAEMREVAETVADAGITPRMALAAAALQDWLTAEMEAGRYQFRPGAAFSWTDVADAMGRAAAGRLPVKEA